MAGIRPGGLSDDEYSDEDQLMECDEAVSKQYSNRNNDAAALRIQVWNVFGDDDYEKWVPYSQRYLFNAIPDTNHNANPTNPNRYSKGNPNPTNPTNPNAR